MLHQSSRRVKAGFLYNSISKLNFYLLGDEVRRNCRVDEHQGSFTVKLTQRGRTLYL